MWPFRRKPEAPSAQGPQPVPAPPIRRDWAGLAPIQRLIGPHPLTAPSDRFSDDLATHRDPSVSTDTMGHQVGADAPAGLVLAIARPTTRSDGPAMIPRPRVQRREAGAVAESGEWDGDVAVPEPARPTPILTSTPAVAMRALPVVAPEPAAQPLVSLAPDVQPTPVAAASQHSRALATSPTVSRQLDEPTETAAAAVPARLTLGQSRRLGLGPPIKRVPERAVQRTSDESTVPSSPAARADEAATTPSMATPVLPEPTLSVSTPSPLLTLPMRPSRGTGAGDLSLEAMATNVPSEPRTPMTTGSLGTSPMDLPLAPRPAMQHPTGDDAPAAPPDLAILTMPISAAGSNLALAAAQQPTASLSFATPGVRLTPPAGMVTASAPARSATAPLVSARPLRPTTSLQRSIDSAASARSQPRPNAAQPGGRDLTAVAESATTEPRPVWAQPRSWADGAVAAPAFSTSESFGLMTTLDQRGRDELPPLEEDGAAPTRILLPLAPSPGLAVQRAVQAAHDSEPQPIEGSVEPVASSVQGAWYEISDGPNGAGSNGTESRGTRGGAAGSAVEAAATPIGHPQTSESDMDELAGKLYDRIRTRLKSELLVDRERAGFLTDLR